MLKSRFIRAIVTLTGISLFSVTAFGAGGEITGMAGGTSLSGGSGARGIFGGSGGADVGERGFIFGEYSYVPLGSFSSGTIKVSSHLQNFGAGYEYRLKERGTSKAVPYALAALGISHGSVSGSTGTTNVSVSAGNALYFGIGAGARVFMGNSWGLKPEIRYQRYSDSGGALNSFIYSVGVFFQFGK